MAPLERIAAPGVEDDGSCGGERVEAVEIDNPSVPQLSGRLRVLEKAVEVDGRTALVGRKKRDRDGNEGEGEGRTGGGFHRQAP